MVKKLFKNVTLQILNFIFDKLNNKMQGLLTVNVKIAIAS